MHLLVRAIPAVVALSFTWVLSACGGGGDEGSGDGATTVSAAEQKALVDPYVGTWAVCLKSPTPGRSWREQYTITKLTATTGQLESRDFPFANEECRGEPEGWLSYHDTVEWTGETRVVDGLTMDQILIKSGTTSSSQAPTEVPSTPATTEYQVVTVVNGNQLRVGTSTESNLQTYPQHLWSEVLQRQ